MKKEAELHAEEDKKKQAEIEAKNMADSLVYDSEKTIKEAGDKIKAEEKKEAEEKIEALKTAQKSGNIEDVKSKTQELSQIMQKIGTELYKNSPPAGEPKPEEPKENNDNAEEGKYTEK